MINNSVNKNKLIKYLLLTISVILISITVVCASVGFVKIIKHNRLQMELQVKEQQELMQAHQILKENFDYVVDTINNNANSSTVLSGTYLIKNEQNLIKLSKLVNVNGINTSTASFVQTSDIVIEGENNIINPIGYYNGTTKCPFKGNYDGQNYTITINNSSLINKDNRTVLGLFGYINVDSGKTVNIKNLNIKYNSSYSDINSHHLRMGGIIGYVEGAGTLNINNSNTYGSINYNMNLTTSVTSGGLIGLSEVDDLKIQDCSSKLNITDTTKNCDRSYIGGFVGHIYNTKKINVDIKNCIFSGKIDLTTESGNAIIGGIVGNYENDQESTFKIECCASIPSYNQSNDNIIKTKCKSGVYVGGILGTANSKFTIDQCFNTSNIYGSSDSTNAVYVGGICGYLNNSSSTISNCYNSGEVYSCSNYVHELKEDISVESNSMGFYDLDSFGRHEYVASYCKPGTFTDSVKAHGNKGDVGNNYSVKDSTFQSNKYESWYEYWYGTDFVGGICGYNTDVSNKISHCFNNGKVYSYSLYDIAEDDTPNNFFQFYIYSKLIYLDEQWGDGLGVSEYGYNYFSYLVCTNAKFYGDDRTGEICGNVVLDSNSQTSPISNCYSLKSSGCNYKLGGNIHMKESTTDNENKNAQKIDINSKTNISELNFSKTYNTFRDFIGYIFKPYLSSNNKFILYNYVQENFPDYNASSEKNLVSIQIDNIFNSTGNSNTTTYYSLLSDFVDVYKNEDIGFGDCWNQNDSINGGVPYLKWAYWDDNATLD